MPCAVRRLNGSCTIYFSIELESGRAVVNEIVGTKIKLNLSIAYNGDNSSVEQLFYTRTAKILNEELNQGESNA